MNLQIKRSTIIKTVIVILMLTNLSYNKILWQWIPALSLVSESEMTYVVNIALIILCALLCCWYRVALTKSLIFENIVVLFAVAVGMIRLNGLEGMSGALPYIYKRRTK